MEQTRRDFFAKSIKNVLGFTIASHFPLECFPQANPVQKAKKIPTMKGQVSSDKLGTTLIHEHLLFGNIPKEKEKESIEFAVKLIKDAERVGINTIVDLSPTRDIKLYQSIASQVSLNIIVSTGSYIQRFMPDFITKMSEEQFKDHLREELTIGIQGTKILAGIIEVVGEKTPLTNWERMKFRAAAQVQKELKVPFSTSQSN